MYSVFKYVLEEGITHPWEETKGHVANIIQAYLSKYFFNVVQPTLLFLLPRFVRLRLKSIAKDKLLPSSNKVPLPLLCFSFFFSTNYSSSERCIDEHANNTCQIN